MAVRKIGHLVGQIDCPNCYTLSEWDSPSDIDEDMSGKKFIICPNPSCLSYIYLDPNRDYYTIRWDTSDQQDTSSSDLVNMAVAGSSTLQE